MISKGFYINFLLGLMTCLAFSSMTYSQSVAPAPPSPTCAICEGKNGQHATSCRYYNPPAGRPGAGRPGTAGSNQLQQLNSLIDLFNTPADNKEIEAKQAEARKQAIEKRQREETLKKERHAAEMKTFKPLDETRQTTGSGTQPASGLSLKPLPSGGAPMSMEERERQIILKQGAGVTWNYDDFTPVPPDNQIPEPTPVPEISQNEELVNNMIAEIESHGGRLAAITGRYILNVKDGVMNYLDDAAYAVTSGNTYVMQETGNFDVRKVTTNALYKTASQTATAYFENASGTVKSEMMNESIGIIGNAAINHPAVYRNFDNLSAAWKQIK